MARRTGRINQKLAHLLADRIGDVLGHGNVQLITAGTQKLDVESDLALFTLSTPATLTLPPIDSACLGYPYRIRNIGTVPLTLQTVDDLVIDRRSAIESVELPPMGNVTIAAIQQEDGSSEWVVLDFTFTTPSFPRLVTGTVFDTATVALPLGLITTIGTSVTTVNMPLDPPTGSAIGIRSDSTTLLNPTIDAGAGRTIQDVGGNMDYSQSLSLGLKRRESFMYAYCADSLAWSAIARPASP